MIADRRPERMSFWILVACVVFVGICLLRIILPFLVPLTLALATAILFKPCYEGMVRACRGRRRIASLLATVIILLIVILPIASVLLLAGQQMLNLADQLSVDDSARERLRHQLLELRETLTDDEYSRWREGVLDGQSPSGILQKLENADAGVTLDRLSRTYSRRDLRQELNTVTLADVFQPENSAWLEEFKARLDPYIESDTLQRMARSASAAIGRALSAVYERTTALISDAVTAIIGFAVMVVAVYYFLAEGPSIGKTVKDLVPMGQFEEEFLFHRFDQLCRGVILGTIASAVAQGALMGVGLAITGSQFVWLLASVTMVCSMIPFLGAAGVYVPVASLLLLQGRAGSAAFILLYGILVVSTSDNLVRMHVLNGRASLHPLAGLVCMLGGLQVIGLWGIFVGPIVAGLFYSLLRLLRMHVDPVHSRQARSLTQPLAQEADSRILIVNR